MEIINKTLPPLLVCIGRDVICASVFAHIIMLSIAEPKADEPENWDHFQINCWLITLTPLFLPQIQSA